MDNILNLIKNVKSFETIKEEVNFFKIIYETFSLHEWLSTDNVFTIGNYIALHRPDLVTLGIRLNVQINLFLRTIKTYSKNYKQIFENIGHSLGCFALTENVAGVISGLIVECQFKKKENIYELNTNDIYKNWISQGIVADYMVIFASNIDNSKDIRIFLCNMNNENINRELLELEPFTNTLDLAKIILKKAEIPSSNILELTIKQSKMEILNGILYGRFMITEAVIHSILGLVLFLKDDIKGIEKFKVLDYDKYLSNLEDNLIEYIEYLKSIRSDILNSKNVFLINCHKIFVVETSIKIFNELNLKFGVRALQYGLKYETLLLNKVAEGDTSILRLSLINFHIKKGLWHIILNKGLSFYEIFNISLINDLNKKKYIINNLQNISDKIIKDNIYLGSF